LHSYGTSRLATPIEGYTFSEVWSELLERLVITKAVASPRGQSTKELLNVQIRVHDMEWNILISEARKLNYRFMVAEWLWILFGGSSVDTIKQYNSVIGNFSDDGKILAGAYGPRLYDQWDYIHQSLSKDLETRQAVAGIWTPSPAPSKDIPCTLTLHFIVRNNVLHLTVNMRSSDIWLGLPYDFFTFSMLANAKMTHMPEVRLGSLTMNLASSHLYETNFQVATKAIRNNSTLKSPRLKESVPLDLRDVLENPAAEYFGDLNSPMKNYQDVLRGRSGEALKHLQEIYFDGLT
jgi:thymidylate synthase